MVDQEEFTFLKASIRSNLSLDKIIEYREVGYIFEILKHLLSTLDLAKYELHPIFRLAGWPYTKELNSGSNKKIITFIVGDGSDYLQQNIVASSYAVFKQYLTKNNTYEQLINNTKSFQNIKSYNFGFGNKHETVKLYSSSKGASIASVYNLDNTVKKFKDEYIEHIQISTIDSFCQKKVIPFINLLKIDVEGNELNVLLGAKKMLKHLKVDFIQFEFGECHVESRVFFKDFFNLLSEDYKIYRVVSDGLWDLPVYNESLEVFHTANFLAERKN